MQILKYFVILLLTVAVGVWGSSGDKVKLKDLSKLTLNAGYFTNGRRSQGVPQLKCVGGSAGCHVFTPKTVECHNRGRLGMDYRWDCMADMDNRYKFGLITVTCEGYDYPDDEYVLRGSCGLEYTIDLKPKDEGSTLGAVGFVIVVVAAVLYKIFLASPTPANGRREHDQENPNSSFDSQPSPPGFRPGFTNAQSTSAETKRR